MAGPLRAEGRFRRVKDRRAMPGLIKALEVINSWATPWKRAERGVRISRGPAAIFHHGRDNLPGTCDDQKGSRSDLIQSAVHIDTWSRSSLRVKLRSEVGRVRRATLASSTKRSQAFVLITFALNSIP